VGFTLLGLQNYQDPYGKDIVKQLSDSCQRANMPLGLYYSTADMHHPYYRDTTKIIGDNYHGEPWRPSGRFIWITWASSLPNC